MIDPGFKVNRLKKYSYSDANINMKAICISDKYIANGNDMDLTGIITMGKIYDVLWLVVSRSSRLITINCDSSERHTFTTQNLLLIEEFRETQIDKILSEVIPS